MTIVNAGGRGGRLFREAFRDVSGPRLQASITNLTAGGTLRNRNHFTEGVARDCHERHSSRRVDDGTPDRVHAA
jgi:hypothetical protein